MSIRYSVACWKEIEGDGQQLFTEISGVCVIPVKNWKGETISYDMMKLQSKTQYV